MARSLAYKFTEDWFSHNTPIWGPLFGELRPKNVLEIGSHEGRSTVWMAEIMNQIGGGSITCIDSWDSEPTKDIFERNRMIASELFRSVKIDAIQNQSCNFLGCMRTSGGGKYDLVYIDGSHKSSDVLSDAVDSFHLCRRGGVIIFDDYHSGSMSENPLDAPKIAIDAFVNCFSREIELLNMPTTTQMFVRKK